MGHSSFAWRPLILSVPFSSRSIGVDAGIPLVARCGNLSKSSIRTHGRLTSMEGEWSCQRQTKS